MPARLLRRGKESGAESGLRFVPTLTRCCSEREGLVEDRHATLDNGDPHACERDVGDRRRPVAVRATGVLSRDRPRPRGRHAERDGAVLDFVSRDRLRSTDRDLRGILARCLRPPLFVQVADGVPVATAFTTRSALPRPDSLPVAVSVSPLSVNETLWMLTAAVATGVLAPGQRGLIGVAPQLDHLENLPVPQRDAPRFAFGLTEGPAPGRFLVGLAALSLLSDVAEERPLPKGPGTMTIARGWHPSRSAGRGAGAEH
jgi:hypothetical protein